MRSAVLAAALLAALLTAAAAGGAAAPQTDLRIAFWPEGREGGTQAQVWRLRCGPVGGTHPRRAQACRTLAALEQPFVPVPRDAACTQIYGGPQEALVTGTHRGRGIWARVHRRDGCHIARWDRHAPVLPVAGGGAAAPGTDLRIAFWPEGRDGGTQPQVWRLRCGPVGGTHPRRAQACRTLAALEQPFRPVPPDAICIQIYGGPQEALVTGTHQGRGIWARVHRRDGCHIARWDRHVPVLPVGGGV